MINYGEGSAQEPRYRTWDGASWSLEQAALPVGGEVRWCELRSCPTRREQLLGVLDANGHLNIQVSSDSTWGNLMEMTTGIGPDNTVYRGFDLEYEQNSGRAVIVYHEGSPDPIYRIWDGNSWSAPQSIDLPSNGGVPIWIELATDPYSNSIALITLDNQNHVEAAIWNGLAWTGDTTLTSNAYSFKEKGVDVSFFGQSGEALFVYCPSNQWGFKYRVYDSRRWKGEGLGPFIGASSVRQVKLAGNGNTDTLGIAYVDKNSIGWAAIWDGANFPVPQNHNFVSSPVLDRPGHCFDIAWEHSLDQAIVVWAEVPQWSATFDSIENAIYCLAAYGGNLYAGTGDEGRVYVFDGTSWNVSADFTEMKVFCLHEYNGKLYAGVSETGKIYAYDGTSWTESYDSQEEEVRSFTVYEGNLYAGTGSTNGVIYVFNGGAWYSSYDSPEKTVLSLAVYNSKLYAGSGDRGVVYTYDGSVWTQSYNSPETSILTLAPYNGKLYAGTSPNGAIYVYDAVSWDVAYDTPEGEITCSSIYDNKLFLGSRPNGNVIVYDDRTWSIAFHSTEQTIRSLAEHDGLFYAGSEGNGIVYARPQPNTEIRYCTWRAGSWSAETFGPDLANQIELVSLASSPAHDKVFLAAATDNYHLHAAQWNGSNWDGPYDLESNVSAMSGMPLSLSFRIGPVPPPLLKNPPDGSWTTDPRPAFQWTPPDHPDIAFYRIDISYDSMFIPPLEVVDSTDTTGYLPSVDLSDGEHFWTVTAVDSMYKAGDPSEIRMVGIDTTPPSKPESLTADGSSPSPWKNVPSFLIDMEHPDEPLGISRHFSKLGTRPDSAGDTSGSFDSKPFIVTTGSEGAESLFVWLSDGLGNVDYTNWEYVLLRYDNQAPESSFARSPVLSNSRRFEVSWTEGIDKGPSGLSGRYEIAVKDGSNPWATWLDNYEGLSDTFDGVAGHTYYFQAFAIDSAGNVEQYRGAECTTFVDTTRPYVVSTQPANGDTGVWLGTDIVVAFSEEMDDTTLNASNITIYGSISGNHAFNKSYSNDTLTLSPLTPFSPGEQATSTVKKEVKDLAGNQMTNDYIATFRVMTPADTAGPVTDTVFSNPEQPQEGIDRITITAYISDDTTGNSQISAAKLFIDSTSGAGSYMNPKDGLFDSPAESVTAIVDIEGWSSGETHIIFVHGRDYYNNWGAFDSALVYVVSANDTIPPSIAVTSPDSGEIDVPTNTWIYVTFSERIDPSTITLDKLNIEGYVSGAHNIAYMNYEENDSTLSINPWGDFAPYESVDVFVASGIKDLGGNPMPNQYYFWFKTGQRRDNNGPWVDTMFVHPETLYSDTVCALTATIRDSITVSEAEYFVDSTGAYGQGLPLTAVGAFGLDSVDVQDSVSVNGFPYGAHWFYIHGKDNSGNWGGFESTSVWISEPDSIGPAFNITSTPDPVVMGESVWVEVIPNKSLATTPACTLWDAADNPTDISLVQSDSTYIGAFLPVGLSTGTGRIQANGIDLFGNPGQSDTVCAIAPGREFLSKKLVYAYPNPAPTDYYGNYVHFRYYVGSNADVKIDIYTIEGKFVDRLEGAGEGGSKENEILWSIDTIASQILFYRVVATSRDTGQSQAVMKKLAIIK